MMDEDTVRRFKELVSDAHWELSYVSFCKKLGWLEDSYAQEKFKAFQDLNRTLNAFDAKTLAKLIGERVPC